MTTTFYKTKIENRSWWKFYLGLIPRFKKHLYYCYSRHVARRNGAIIGESSVISLSLARKANNNLVIGNHCSIQTDLIDLRSRVKIENHVIIGAGVEIITCSHDIDSAEWEFKSYGLEIEDYAWIATRSFILPSCRKIGRGAVCAAGSVVVKSVDEMSIVSGNPAQHLRFRLDVHSKLVVESLLSGDLKQYILTWKAKQ